MSTTEQASEAPASAIAIRMTSTNGPRFEPDHLTAKAGTAVFFLENIPSTMFSPDHNMLIGPANVHFYGDGSVASSQVLARTQRIRARETVAFTVNDLAPGSYVFWCSVEIAAGGGNHASNGMVGTLTMTP